VEHASVYVYTQIPANLHNGELQRVSLSKNDL